MKLIPDWSPGTTKFQGSPDDAAAGAEYLGQTFNVRDKIFNTAHVGEYQAVRVTKTGGLIPNRPWALNADGTQATDYADGTGDYNVALPDPELPEVAVEENDICYVVNHGFARCRATEGGDATGFAPGTLVTHDTGGDGEDAGLKSEATISKATLGQARSTLAATTDGNVTVFVWPRNR